MSFLARRFRNQLERIQPFSNYTTLPSFFTAGGSIGRERAMQLATVWACVKLRAETIASLPVGPVEYQGASRIPKDPPPWLQRPNPETTRFELFERTSASIDTDGNAYWYIERDRLNRVAEVWVLPAQQTVPFRDPPRRAGDPPGPKRFRIGSEEFGADRIVHFTGFTLPGRLRGLSPIEQHAHALGLAVAAEDFGEQFFANGAAMQVVLEHPGDPGRDGARRMQDTFAKDHSGLRNAFKPGVIFGGTKLHQLSVPNEQAQFLETRRFQREEICGIFRVPPHKIGILDKATFSNIEHQGIEWATDGVAPFTARIESAVLAAGLLDRGQQLRFNLAGLLRGDTASRFAAFAIARQWGWLNVDEIRAFEDMNPLPDGKGETYLEPLNMVPAGERPEVTDQVANALRRAGATPELIAAVTGQPAHQEVP